MRVSGSIRNWVSVPALLIFSQGALAQFSTTLPPLENTPPKRAFEWQPTYLAVYPYAQFRGFVGSKSGGSSNGEILSLEAPFRFQSMPNDLAIGGWAYFQNGGSIYELHAKAYLSRQFGLQAGTLGGSGTSKQDFDAFALFSPAIRPTVNSKNRFDYLVQFAGGAYDYSSTGSGFQPSGFVNTSLIYNRRWTLNASYWYIATKVGHYDRTALGIGYLF